MKRTIFLFGVMSLALALLVGSHPTKQVKAQEEARRPSPNLPNYDIRTDKNMEASEALLRIRQSSNKDAVAVASVRDGFVTGEDALRLKVPSLKVEYNEDLRIPEVISPDITQGPNFLTGNSAAKHSEILLGFIKENSSLLGVSELQANQLEIEADYKNPEDELSFVNLEQKIKGIPVFRGELKAVFTREGEIGRVINNLAPGLNYESLSTDFRNPEDAVRAAFPQVTREMNAEDTQLNAAESTDLKSKFGSGDWATTAEKIYFPTEPGVAVPAWRVIIWEPVNVYMVIVDAGTGRMLWRKNATREQTQSATYNVYTNPNAMINVADSPAPMSPGPVNPNLGTQSALINRTNVTRVGNEAPYTFNLNGWIRDGSNIATDGNAVEAGVDHASPNGIDHFEFADQQRVFSSLWNPPPGNPAPGDNPLTSQAQRGAVIQLFYTMNLYHDELYRLGFTEQAGNYQDSNFGRGGKGMDSISAEAQDSSGIDNANFSTVPDGTRGRMQMYLWDGPNPDRDGSADAEIVIHEATHGTSDRLIGNASGLTTAMSNGLSEGWSDFYAHAMLSQASDPIEGIYAIGGYSTHLVNPGFTSNYYYGYRRFPKAVKSFLGPNGKPHNPLSFRHLNSNCSTEIGTPQAIGTISAFPRGPIGSMINCDSFHNSGEIWSSALWEVRARFITRLGWAEGNRRLLQIVTNGMKVTPLNPTFLQARDAALFAAFGTGDSADIADLWIGFSIRGLGLSASIQNPGNALNDTAVTEAFNLPLNIANIEPNKLSFTSTVGGSNPTNQNLEFNNFTPNWTASDNADWLTVSTHPNIPGRAIIAVNSSGLAAGIYSTNIRFDMSGSFNSYAIVPVTLTVNPSPTVPNPASLNFTTTVGTNPASQPLSITNIRSSSLSLGISDFEDWLSAAPTTFSNIAPGATVTTQVTVNSSGLGVGTYNGKIRLGVVAEGITREVPVTLTVKPVPPVIQVTPSSLSIAAALGGRNPDPFPLRITNSGGGTLKWTATDDVSWLTLSPTTANVLSGKSSSTTVSINIAGLGLGTHNGNISISAPGAAIKNIPVEITITLPTQ